MNKTTYRPVHPGEILRGALLPQFGLTATEAAISMRVSPELMFKILDERKPISAEMCLRVARFFDSSPEMWQRLQASYDLHQARQDERISHSVRSIVPVLFLTKPQPDNEDLSNRETVVLIRPATLGHDHAS